MIRPWPFRRRSHSNLVGRWALSQSLLRWSRTDTWTIRDAVEGCLILGATGSGKSSGSGQTIARAMLDAGFGGLVLTAKADERSQWERYCREAGRLDDLRVFGPSQGLTFNFLDHEFNRSGVGAGLTENVVNLFSTVLEVADRGSSGGSGRDDEGYWRRANRQLIRNTVDLLSLATGRVSVPDLYRIVVSAPSSFEQLNSEGWKAGSVCYRCLVAADEREKTPRQGTDFEMVTDYFCLEFPGLSEKTRSVIVSTFTSMIDVINRGVLRELFCGETNITPQEIEGGKIILVDLPAKEFAEVGIFAQVLWKYAYQRSIERRSLADDTRPVFLWADEAQHFVTSYDREFQATCRSARVATVYLSQNVAGFEAALGGGGKGKAETAALFANLNSKILHANGDPGTNEWASSIVGRSLQSFVNTSHSQADEDWLPGTLGFGATGQTSSGCSESYEFEIQPSEFCRLRTGGPDNGCIVDAIIVASGKQFHATGRTWMPVSFKQ